MHVSDGLYIMAAAVCDSGGCEPVRVLLRSLLDAEQPRLHWGTESPPRRMKIMEAIARIDMAAVVVIGTPLAKKKQERARAVCMESLVVHLAEMGVTRVVLEERHPSLNDRDRRLIDSLRGKKLMPSHMWIDIERPSTEPMLWIADVVAGAVGAARVRGQAEYLDLIRGTVTELDIPLR